MNLAEARGRDSRLATEGLVEMLHVGEARGAGDLLEGPAGLEQKRLHPVEPAALKLAVRSAPEDPPEADLEGLATHARDGQDVGKTRAWLPLPAVAEPAGRTLSDTRKLNGISAFMVCAEAPVAATNKVVAAIIIFVVKFVIFAPSLGFACYVPDSHE